MFCNCLRPPTAFSQSRPHPLHGPWRLLAGIAVWLSVGGCVGYAPQPLAPEQILIELNAVRLENLPAIVDSEGLKSDPDALATVSRIGRLLPAGFRCSLADGLNADEAAYAALKLNPDFQVQLAVNSVAAGEVLDAGLWPNPEWDGEARFATQGGAKEFETGLSIEVLRWDERSARAARAQAGRDAAFALLLDHAWRLCADTRRAWWQIVAARERLALSVESVTLTEKLAAALQGKLRQGAATSLEVNIALLDAVQAKLVRQRRETEVAAAERALQRLLGLPPDAPTPLEIPAKPFTPADPPLALAAATGLLPQAAALQAAAHDYQVAEEALREAVAGQYPGLRIGPAASFEYDGEWTSFLGLAFSLDLPLFNRNQGAIARATADRDHSRAAYVAQLHQMRADLADAHADLAGQRRLLEFMNREVLPPAAETLRLTEKSFAAGELDLLQLLQAQTAVIAIKEQYLEALIADRMAYLDCETAGGRLFESPPGAPTPVPTPPQPEIDSLLTPTPGE